MALQSVELQTKGQTSYYGMGITYGKEYCKQDI